MAASVYIFLFRWRFWTSLYTLQNFFNWSRSNVNELRIRISHYRASQIGDGFENIIISQCLSFNAKRLLRFFTRLSSQSCTRRSLYSFDKQSPQSLTSSVCTDSTDVFCYDLKRYFFEVSAGDPYTVCDRTWLSAEIRAGVFWKCVWGYILSDEDRHAFGVTFYIGFVSLLS